MFDLFHYAGHGEHDDKHPENSGWILKDGKLTAADIATQGNDQPMPSLIFSNACQSGSSGNWDEGDSTRLFGMANAFLLAGARHYLGSFWDLADESGHAFAVHVYKALLEGVSIGHAVCRARNALVEEFGEDSILWANHMLYGDPAFIYYPEPDVTMDREAEDGDEFESQSVSTTSMTAIGHGMQPWGWVAAAGIVLALILAGASLLRPNAPQVVTAPQQPVVVQKSEPADMEAAVKLYQQGDFAGAIPLLQARVDANGRDRMAATFLKAAKQRVAMAQDAAQQQRVDELAQSLIEQQRNGGAAAAPLDEWTSRPLSVAILDPEIKGESILDAGQQAYVPLGLADGLQQNERIRLVDRALMEKILGELKLGTSDLADPATQLRLGRILSARVLVTGNILSMGGRGQVGMRMIDVETSEVIGQARERFDSKSDLFTLMDQLTANVASGIEKAYPIQCRVSGVNAEGELELNAGSNIGLKAGMQLSGPSGEPVTVVRVEKDRAFASGDALPVETPLQRVAADGGNA